MESDERIVVVAGTQPQILVEVKTAFSEYFDVLMASTGEAVQDEMEDYEVAAIIICAGDEPGGAFGLMQEVRACAQALDTPVILLAEKADSADEAKSYELGAADYAVRTEAAIGTLAQRIIARSETGKYTKGAETGGNAVPAAAPEAALRGKCILIADDVETNRLVIADMFTGIEDLTLELVGDGDEAVDKFNEAPDRYALILMDVLMPEMDGFEATEAIRGSGRENAKDIPIIALTASPMDEDIDNCLAAGMNDFIRKPVERDSLLAVCAKYCK